MRHFESSRNCLKTISTKIADNTSSPEKNVHDEDGLGVLSYDMPVRCVLILVQVHFQQLGNSSALRPMLTTLQQHMRALLCMDQKRIGYVMAGLNLFQNDMKKNKTVFADVAPEEPAAKRQRT